MPMINRLLLGAGARFLPAFGFLIALAPTALLAQDGDLRSLSDQVQRLQRELTDLQRQVYAGGGATGVAPGDTSLDASQEVRLQQLEEQLRALTGQVEEASFGVRQLGERLDKLVEDVDFRLRALEQGGAAVAGAPDQPEGQADGPMVAAGEAPATSAPSGAGSTSAGPQTLGSLTMRQLDAFQAQTAGTAGAAQSAAQGQTAALPAAPADARGGTPEEQYDHAFGLLRQANYVEAENALKGFLERFPEHPLAGNAQYWLGETYYVRGDYTEAAVAFAEGYQKYPKGGKAPDNLLKLGMSLAEIGQKEDACRAFTELSRQFPDAPANLMDRANRERQRHGCS